MYPKFILPNDKILKSQMMTILQNDKLYLPELDSSLYHRNIPIEVSPDFRKAWSTRLIFKNSAEPSAKEIEKLTVQMEILVRNFCKFINIYRGADSEVIGTAQKTGPKDLVTLIDKGIEQLLRLWINRNFSTHKIIGEEGAKDLINITDFVWYIDPVDGTRNFVENNEFDVGLNISLVKSGRPVLALLGMPRSGYYYVGSASRTKVEKVELSTGRREEISYKNNYKNVRIGTEYSEIYKGAELARQERIRKHFGPGTVFQMLFSSSTNVASFLDKKINVFYQDVVKFWDIMAPISLLYFMDRTEKHFVMKILMKGGRIYNYFGNYDQQFIEEINQATDERGCKVGYFLIYDQALGRGVEEILNFKEAHTI